MPNHEPTKCSFKRNGIVKAYAANTNQGLVRNYNEDRVSIILNIMKPASRANEDWPKCSFFGVIKIFFLLIIYLFIYLYIK